MTNQISLPILPEYTYFSVQPGSLNTKVSTLGRRNLKGMTRPFQKLQRRASFLAEFPPGQVDNYRIKINRSGSKKSAAIALNI